ncbi:MAG: cyclic nucleotide-binding domain-containing protein [Vulcanimicrobiota bacterium]
MDRCSEGFTKTGKGIMKRGGALIEGHGFLIQIGVYPETIKDTMNTERGVPDLYLMPEELFDTDTGVSAGDLEFPVYYNYYLKGRKCRFVCRKHQLKPLVQVLREALFGPAEIMTEREFIGGKNAPGFPDLMREMAFYKENSESPEGRLRLRHVIRPYLFDDDGTVTVDGVKISIVGHNIYRFEKDGDVCDFHHEPASLTTFAPADLESSSESSGFYSPPIFGVTVIGSGHGFDADADTAGFIIWVDGKGVLVDPPVNSTAWFRRNHINTRLIEDLILTHCHADHDSGTLQKILEEGRVRVHSTETIINSFITKYCALTDLSYDDFHTLFEFEPVHIGEKIKIAGAEFLFKYTLHPVPTISFEVTFQSQSFFYSSDTFYDPDEISALHDKGVISRSRMEDLLNVPWNDTVVFHEAGIPPVHTPITVLEALPDSVKEHLYLVHVSEDSIPENKGLKLAMPGVSNTISFDVSPPETSLAYKMLDVMAHIDLFKDMPVEKALEFISFTHHRLYSPGEIIIARGTIGENFFMVLSGEVEVIQENQPQRLKYTRYDYFGERAIILGLPRSADIVARTPAELLYMSRHDFLHFIKDSNIADIFRRLNINRLLGARQIFDKHRVLAALSCLQKNQLMCMMKREDMVKGTVLYNYGDAIMSYYLIEHGEVLMQWGDREVRLGPGATVGDFDRNLAARVHTGKAVALTNLSLFRIMADDMRSFFAANPGTFIRFLRLRVQ